MTSVEISSAELEYSGIKHAPIISVVCLLGPQGLEVQRARRGPISVRYHKGRVRHSKRFHPGLRRNQDFFYFCELER